VGGRAAVGHPFIPNPSLLTALRREKTGKVCGWIVDRGGEVVILMMLAGSEHTPS